MRYQGNNFLTLQKPGKARVHVYHVLIKKKVYRLENQVTEGKNYQDSWNDDRTKGDIFIIKCANKGLWDSNYCSQCGLHIVDPLGRLESFLMIK